METRAPSARRRRRQIIVGLAAVGLLTALLLPNGLRLRALETRTRAVDADIARLEAMVAQLSTEQTKLQNDPTYLERVARQEFHATREGETLIKLEDAADGPMDSAPVSPPQPQSSSRN